MPIQHKNCKSMERARSATISTIKDVTVHPVDTDTSAKCVENLDRESLAVGYPPIIELYGMQPNTFSIMCGILKEISS